MRKICLFDDICDVNAPPVQLIVLIAVVASVGTAAQSVAVMAACVYTREWAHESKTYRRLQLRLATIRLSDQISCGLRGSVQRKRTKPNHAGYKETKRRFMLAVI